MHVFPGARTLGFRISSAFWRQQTPIESLSQYLVRLIGCISLQMEEQQFAALDDRVKARVVEINNLDGTGLNFWEADRNHLRSLVSRGRVSALRNFGMDPSEAPVAVLQLLLAASREDAAKYLQNEY